ncbi:BAI_1a_G0025290.mRNA.1.CDS.1 [Saccharomyces cerevisiae]|nr:BAI_1a_G0025290.mRNA.1.CDS.1 [Saccharomyces cerevisiae]CAI7161034.1 BAI_1a_G0025290.mRNA.1.CDS.1 [Saccharomyces cerevisiae]
MYKIIIIYLWPKSYLSFSIGIGYLDCLTLITFSNFVFKQARFARCPGFFL